MNMFQQINEINMKHKIGDTVKIKSLQWFNENSKPYEWYKIAGLPAYVYVSSDNESDDDFVNTMCEYCGKSAIITNVVEIKDAHSYTLDIDNGVYNWNDYMFED